jgi:hypothetical protein
MSKAKRTCGQCKHWLGPTRPKRTKRGKGRWGDCYAPIPASAAEDYRIEMEANCEDAEYCACFKRKKPKA